MLEGGELFVFGNDLHYGGSANAIAATQLQLDGKVVLIPEPFRRRLYRGDRLKLLGENSAERSAQ